MPQTRRSERPAEIVSEQILLPGRGVQLALDRVQAADAVGSVLVTGGVRAELLSKTRHWSSGRTISYNIATSRLSAWTVVSNTIYAHRPRVSFA